MKALNVLWIEDAAEFELAHLAGPVFIDGKCNLVTASNVTEALELIYKGEYDVIIVDIRLPPGNAMQWEEVYKRAGQHKSIAGLGLRFLKTILGSETAEVRLPTIPNWIRPEIIGVFTVERYIDLKESLDALEVCTFRQKTAEMPATILLDLIHEICSNTQTRVQ